MTNLKYILIETNCFEFRKNNKSYQNVKYEILIIDKLRM
jgi:hypothetical protein